MIYSSEQNLSRVQDAITEIVLGNRKVSVTYTSPDGGRNQVQYTEVSIKELRDLERQMISDMSALPMVSSIEVEVLF